MSVWCITGACLSQSLLLHEQRRDLFKWAHRVLTKDGSVVFLVDAFDLGAYKEAAKVAGFIVEHAHVAELSTMHFGANG